MWVKAEQYLNSDIVPAPGNSGNKKTQPELVVHRPATQPVMPSLITNLTLSSSAVGFAEVSGTSAPMLNKSSGHEPSLQYCSPQVGGSWLSFQTPLATVFMSGLGGGRPSSEMPQDSPSLSGTSFEMPPRPAVTMQSATLNFSNALFGLLPLTVIQSISSSSINAAVSQNQSLALHPSSTATNLNTSFV